MKKLLLLGILFLIGYIGKAQRVYFIYLETDKGIPFYVKMGDKIYSSSTAGYLILSNLKDSTYTFAIGLAGKRQAEPRFQVAVSGADHGYLIKEIDQKLNLFDLQSLELTAPLSSVETNKDTYFTRNDNFTRTLSLAVNDPTLLLEVVRRDPVQDMVKGKAVSKEVKSEIAVAKETIVEKPAAVDSAIASTFDSTAVAISQSDSIGLDATLLVEAKRVIDSSAIAKVDTLTSIDTVAIAVMTTSDTAIIKDTTLAKVEIITEEPKKEDLAKPLIDTVNVISTVSSQSEIQLIQPEYKRSTIIRRSESSTTQGFGLTFIDYSAATTDTIRILIPNQKSIYKSSIEASSQIKEPLKTIPDIEVSVHSDTILTIDTSAKSAITMPLTTDIKSCNSLASDRDFKDLRKEMAALETDEGMINTATIVFNEKCFTTAQVKNLSTLFLSAQWKYQFFAAAQKYIADPEKFATLESEIQDDYYLNRFKALVAK